MLFFSPLRRAVAVFFLLLFLAVMASAVCVAFGAGAIPSLAPVPLGAGSRCEAALRQTGDACASLPSAATQVAGPASRAGVGT